MKDGVKVAAGLRHVGDDEPGLTRIRRGRGFSYHLPDGARLKCATTRARIAGLGIPPAWRDVWICRDGDGHIQATGIDAAGRKQYRYHPDWQDWRAQVKFDQLADFGGALPRLRRRAERDLDAPPGSQEFALAALILLIDRAFLRIGSARHTARSGTYGATTLLRRHLRIHGPGRVELRFRAKGGKQVRRRLDDRRLHRALERIADLPGAALFTWIDGQGDPRPVSSQMVNSYLAEACGLEAITAKTFRTWSGSVAALSALRQAQERATIKALCAEAAEVLHNTPAICRASYIHPLLFDLVDLPAEDRLARLGNRAPTAPRGLHADERRLFRLLTAGA
jgi:DNA topoisomerase I